MKIDGQVAVVTGGASGLGKASAELLAGRGARVVISDLPNSAGDSVAAEIGNGCLFVPADAVIVT